MYTINIFLVGFCKKEDVFCKEKMRDVWRFILKDKRGPVFRIYLIIYEVGD